VNKELITKLNESPTKVFIAATGGGSSFIGDYLKIPGGSKTILGFLVPYAQALFDEFIGGKPDKYVSSVAARKLAVASYDKSRKLRGNLGMGVSCSLATGEGEREGRENWVHIAVHGSTFTSVYDTRIDHTFSTRNGQEAFVARIMLDILAYESGLLPDFIKWEGESYERHEDTTGAAMVMNVDNPVFVYMGNEEYDTFKASKKVILAGSFNPFHEAHAEMARLATEITGYPTVLELCTKNVDKAGLDYLDLKTRLEPIKDKYPIIITTTPLIMDKISLLKETLKFGRGSIVFAMGKDTWNRFLNPKYDKDIQSIAMSLEWMGVKFLVFGREGDSFDKHHPAEKWRIQDSRAENFDMKMRSSDIRAGQMARL
jgi:nicotinic acid mononucleotide adenylyltransferase